MESVSKTTWRSIFSPETIAVIGASATPGSWGHNAVRGLAAEKGRHVYPVNPKGGEILGIKVYPSITDVPESVDMAVIVVSAGLVPDVLRQCVDKGVKVAVIISSGFGEMGESGQETEKELVEIARSGGLRFIGPNSMGHADTGTKISTFGQGGEMPEGPVAVLSQSGNMCLKIMRSLAASGIHCSKYISTGNEADLHMEDFLEYLAEDDKTRVIATYVEGLRDGRRFFELAKRITPHKPVVVLKAGGSEGAAKAVMSHTGSLAGSDTVYTAAFKQSGVIRVDDDDELCDVVDALLNSPLPRGNRVGILSIGGGPAALTAEACEKEGLAISKLEPETIQKLDGYLSSRWPRRNPVDMAGPTAADFSRVANLLFAIIEDRNVDAVLLLAPLVMDRTMLTGRMGLNPEQVKAYREKEEKNLGLIREKIEQYGKPVLTMWQWRGFNSDQEMNLLYHRNKIMVYGNTRRAARIMGYLTRYRHYLDTVKCK
jgi:acetyl-CoA synthetase (ADP-forming)